MNVSMRSVMVDTGSFSEWAIMMSKERSLGGRYMVSRFRFLGSSQVLRFRL